MPTYDITIPGKGDFTVESPTELTDEQVYYAVERQLMAEEAPPAEPEVQPETGFVAGAKSSIERLKADWYAWKASQGDKEAAKLAAEYRKRAGQLYQQPEFTEHPVDYFTGLLGQAAPYVAAPLVAGVAANPLGAGAALTAAGLTSAAQFTGSNLSRQLEAGVAPEDLSVSKAVAAAVPQAALDVIGLKYIPGIRNIFARAGMQLGEREAAGIVNRYIIPGFKTAGIEGGTEAAQAVLERMQAGLELDSPEAKQEYLQNFLGGAVLGGVLSVPGTMIEGGGRAQPMAKAATPTIETEEPSPEIAPEETTPVETTTPTIETEEPSPEIAPEETAPVEIAPAEAAPLALGYEPSAATSNIAETAAQATENIAPEVPDVNQLMAEHAELRTLLDPLAEKIQAAEESADSETARTLQKQYTNINEQIKNLETEIADLGGVTQSREEIEQEALDSVKGIDSKIATLQNKIKEYRRSDVRDYEAAEKADTKIEELQAERDEVIAEFQRKQAVLRERDAALNQLPPTVSPETAVPSPMNMLVQQAEAERIAPEVVAPIMAPEAIPAPPAKVAKRVENKTETPAPVAAAPAPAAPPIQVRTTEVKEAPAAPAVDEAQLAQEIGIATPAYKAYSAPYLQQLQTRANAFNAFVQNGQQRLRALKQAVGVESPRYQTAKEIFVRTAKERREAYNAFETPIREHLKTAAERLGRAHPKFVKKTTPKLTAEQKKAAAKEKAAKARAEKVQKQPTKAKAEKPVQKEKPVEKQAVEKEVEEVPTADYGVTDEGKSKKGFKSFRHPDVTSSIVGSQPTVIDKLKANFLGLSGRVQMVDKFAAISEAFKKGLSAGEVSSLEASNAEYFLRFGENRSQYAQQALTHGPVQLTVSRETKAGKEFVYKSSKGANLMRVYEILQKAGIKKSTELDRMFTVYMAGKRAQQVGWEKLWAGDPAKARAEHAGVMAQLQKNPKAAAAFEEATAEYKAFNNGLIDFLVQTGTMRKEKAAELKAIDYVPYYRVNKGSGAVEMFVDKEKKISIGNIKDEPQLQTLVGDNTQILPLSVSAVQNAFMLTDMALRNQRVKDTAFMLHKIGIASRIGKGVGPSTRDTVRFKHRGEDHFVTIDTDLYGIPADLIIRGMEGIQTTMPAIINLMGVPADWLRKFVTRNPAYAVRQAIRDPLTAWMTTGVDGVPVLNSLKELGSMVAKRSTVEQKLMEAGAISSNVFTGDKKDMEKFLRDVSQGKSVLGKAAAWADAFALQGDAATRAVIYKDSIAKGMSEQQALLRTLESMNFGRHGLSPTIKALSIMIPFFNTQIQSIDVLYRAFKGQMPYSQQLEIKKKLMARGALLTIGTIAYAAMMQDDEAYKNAKPEERLGNWFIRIPGVEDPVRVPIPFELGYLFKALPEALWNSASKDEKSKDITKGMGKLIGLMNPLALPAAVKPFTEVYLGRSFFGGDIESQREVSTMLPTERYRVNTTGVARFLGGILGDTEVFTPIKIDHLIRGHTGGLGVALVSLADPLFIGGTQQAELPSKRISQQPIIGGLFQTTEGRGPVDAAYERMLEIQQARGTYKRMVEAGNTDKAKEFLEEYGNKVAAASLSGRIQQKMGELSKLRRRIVEAPTMSQTDKDKALKNIDEARRELAKRFVAATE